MDSYCEQLVAKTRTAGDTAKMVLSIVISVLIAALFIYLILFIGLIGLIFAGVSIGLGVWIASDVNIEYEYIITNDEMDIDKIIGKRKRKRMITVDLKRITDFETLPCSNENFEVVVQASGGLEGRARCMFVEHSDYGSVKIIFDPNKKIREAIAQAAPKQLRGKVVGEHVE